MNTHSLRYFLFSILCFLLAQKSVLAQDIYYVSNTGSDINDGLSQGSPWQTISKVNSEMNNFQAGDQILFLRGNTFTGSLTISTQGVSFGAYGNGDKPTLSGGISLNGGWIPVSGNIWEITLTDAPPKLNNLHRDGNRLPLGRYPNHNSEDGGFLRIESSPSLSQIIDDELDNSVDWTGSDVVIKVLEYRFNRVDVVGHSGTTLSLGDGFDVTRVRSNSGYYFVNHIDALDLDGEWFYDEGDGKIYLYSASDPNNSVFTYPFQDIVIDVDNVDDIFISDIQVGFGNAINIMVDGADNLVLENIDLKAAGGEGIQVEGSDGVSVSNSYFEEVNIRSLYVINGTTNITIQDNNFYNIGMDPAYGKEKGLYCIYNESDGAQILRNNFDQIGGGAIVTGGKNQLIRRNYINNALKLIDDMGGIYTNFNLGGLTTAGTIIEENIVSNCLGNHHGSYQDRDWAIGIYLDNHTNDVIVRNNTVFNVGTICYFLHINTGEITFYGNTALGGPYAEVFTYLYDQASSEVQYHFYDNIFASKDTVGDHLVWNYESSVLDFDESGRYYGNYFISPFVGERIRLRYIDGSAGNAEIYNTYNMDFNRPAINSSSNSPISFSPGSDQDNLQLFMNPTGQDSTITLPDGKYIDVKNEGNYCGSINLSPFTSKILVKYSDASCEIPDSELGELIGFKIDDLSDVYCEVSWSQTPNAINYDLRYKSEPDTSWLYVNNLTDTVFTIAGLEIQEDYECQVRASGAGVETAWSDTLHFTTLIEAPCEGPKNVSAHNILMSSVDISWNDFRVAQFVNIRYRERGTSTWIESDSIDDEEYHLFGLQSNTTYEWQLQSVCDYGITSWIPQDDFQTLEGAFFEVLESSTDNQWVVRDINTNEISFVPHQSVMLVGRRNDTQSGIAVYPFQLPEFNITNLQEANFKLLLDNNRPVGNIVADLWALPFRQTSTVTPDDYFDGAFSGANQSDAALLQEGFIDPERNENVRQVVFTNTNSSGFLKSFISDQYQQGASGGEWFFLRINPTAPSVQNRHWLDRAEDRADGIPSVRLIYSTSATGQPTAASNVTAEFNGNESILIQWVDESSDEDGFILERRVMSELSKGDFVILDSLEANTAQFIDINTSIGIDYEYRVLSYNSTGVQGYSNIALSKTSIYPEAPTSLMAIFSLDTIVFLEWLDHADNEQGFIIERNSNEQGFVAIDSVGADETTYSDSNVVLSGNYVYRVKAYNEFGSSEYSNEVLAEIEYPIYFVNANLENVTPGDAIVSNGSGNDNLWSYRTSSNGTVDGNYVESYRQLGDNSPDIFVIVNDSLVAANSYNIYIYVVSPASQDWQVLAKLPNQTDYQAIGRNTPGVELLNDNDGVPDRLYRALLGEVTGSSDFQVDVSDDFTTGGVVRSAFDGVGYQLKELAPAPVSPTNLEVTISTTSSVQLTWEDNSDDEVGFVIERSIDLGGFELIDSVAFNVTDYIDNNLDVNSTYSYRVYAYNTAGNSEYSNTVNVDIAYPINFINADLNNVFPSTAINSVSSGSDHIWSYKNTGNGTVDGNYVESYMQLGEDCQDISIIVDDSLNALHTYNIYLYVVSPASQDWQVLAKLPDQTNYLACGRNTPGAELLNDNDGVPDRLYRILLGEVSGTTGFRVDLSDDLSASVLRAAFDGVAYQVKELGEVPNAPSDLIAEVDGISSVALSWVDNSDDELGFIIERSLNANDFVVIDTVSSGVTNYTDEANNYGELNAYRIAAYKVGGQSAYSDTANILVPYLLVQLKDGDQDIDDNQIKPHMQLINLSNDLVGLSDISIRYWFISENHDVLNGYVDWAEIGNNNINISFVKCDTAYEGANWYMEISFNNSVVIDPLGSSGQMKLRMAKSNWTTFDENNDYSFNGSSIYELTEKMTIHENGELIWGKVPTISRVQEAQVKVIYKSGDKFPNNNHIKPHFELINSGNQSVPVEEITVRYYFLAENTNTQYQYNLDYVESTTIAVSGDFDKHGNHEYIEFSFSGDELAAYSGSGEFRTRINAIDWSVFDESNDYSFIDTSVYVLNNRMAVYRNDQLVFGTEPDSNSASRLVSEGEALNNNAINFFPNPVMKELHLEISPALLGKRALLSLVDLSGKEVFREDMILDSSREIQLSAPQGVYLLKVRIPELNQIWKQRIIKN